MTRPRLRPRLRSSLISLRRAFGQTRWAGTVKRWRRAQPQIPRLTQPDPAFLRRFPGEARLSAELRDERLVTDAIAWATRKGATVRSNDGSYKPTGGPPGSEAPSRRPITNVVFISHCDFTGNSALHVLRIASELHARGLSPLIAVPDDAETVDDVGRPPFPVLTYRDVQRRRLRFPDGHGPDLVHAFTPRERVRKLAAEMVRTYACPYVLHLEDDDRAILSAEMAGASIEDLERLPAPFLDAIIHPSRLHPLRGKRFVEHAAGVTVVTDRLLELVPGHVLAKVVRPGFDEAVLSPTRSREDVRAELGLQAEDFAIVYPGSIHVTNLEDMRSLYLAVAELRRNGHPVVLVKTGWNVPEASDLPRLEDGIRNLGWVTRDSLPGLLAAADALVQPGAPGPFNDYRFPAKVPDFLASGRPVILPRANIGLSLAEGDAIVLDTGTVGEIYRAIALVRGNPELAAGLGEHGRAFALRELRWSKSVDNVEELYRGLADANWRADPPWALDLDPPVKVICLVASAPAASEARVARAHGIYGFCFPAVAGLAHGGLDFPFCFRIRGDASEESVVSAFSELSNPAYIRVLGAPLLLADDLGAAERWRSKAEVVAGEPIHFALVGRSVEGSPGRHGFDSVVEMPDVPGAADAADGAMRKHLGISLPEYSWFRGIAFPEGRASRSVYGIWLRKLVLQCLCRASAQEPLIFVDPGAAWSERRTSAAWLRGTRSALLDGIQQFYSSMRLEVSTRRIEDALRLE
jgi:glycosyltransferase involved in cell wall biosynthesis